jgi:hypothetical protein
LSSFWLILKQQWTIEEISIFSNSSHLEWRAGLSDTIWKGTHPGTIPASSNEQSKFHPPFFLFLAWRPSWLEVGITGHVFGRGPSKDHSTKVWFKLAQWLQRSWLKCEKLTDGRSVVTIAHMTLWVRWAKKEEEIFIYQ